MTQNRRQEAMNGFRDGKYDILVATDIAARGIDVSDISHVINFDIPDTVDAYTHRIGRTGRAAQTGEAFTFIGEGDEPMVSDIERLLARRIERRRLPGFNYGSFDPEQRTPRARTQSSSRRAAPARTRNRQAQPRNGSTPEPVTEYMNGQASGPVNGRVNGRSSGRTAQRRRAQQRYRRTTSRA